MTPGSQQEDPRFVAGGGGFKIEKESKSHLLNLAKKYGMLIPDQQGGQGGAPSGGMPQMPQMPQMGQMGQGAPSQASSGDPASSVCSNSVGAPLHEEALPAPHSAAGAGAGAGAPQPRTTGRVGSGSSAGMSSAWSFAEAEND